MIIEVFGCSFSAAPVKNCNGCGVEVPKSVALWYFFMDRSEIETVSKALSDKARLKILETISSASGMNCSEIVSMRGVTPATVPHRHDVLSKAGLIGSRRQGQLVYSKAAPGTVAAYTQALTKIARKGRTPRR